MAAISNWDRIYYKLGQVLQIKEIVTAWGITPFILCFLAPGISIR